LDREGERERERGRESNLKWSDQGQLARDLQGSGRECVEVKHNSHNPFLKERKERRRRLKRERTERGATEAGN